MTKDKECLYYGECEVCDKNCFDECYIYLESIQINRMLDGGM